MTRTSDIHRLNLMDRDGRILRSSRPELIGRTHDGSHFAESVTLDTINYEVDFLRPKAIDDFGLQFGPADRDSPSAVAEIDLPVQIDGTFVGAIEIHRDITRLREAFITRVRLVLSIIAAGATLSLLMLALIIHRAGRSEMRVAEARAGEQQTLMADQMRLAREVRLLGALNEWLRSNGCPGNRSRHRTWQRCRARAWARRLWKSGTCAAGQHA